MASKKILCIVTNHSELGNTGKKTGWYLPELAHPYHVFQKNGYSIECASPLGGYSPVDEESKSWAQKDTICAEFLNGEDTKALTAQTKKFSDCNPDDYAAIFIAGGHGPMWDLPKNEILGKLLTAFFERNAPVSAVCHGPVGLLPSILTNGDPLVKGRKVCSFTNAEESTAKLDTVVPFALETALRNLGAIFVGGDKCKPNVQRDGYLVTGQNPASATPTAEAVIDVLNGK